MSVNRITLLGRLGKDPELKYTPSSVALCTFSIATSEKFKGKDGAMQEVTQWHNVKVWGKLGEICNQFLSKGREVYLEGSVIYEKWDKDGETRTSTTIKASKVDFIGSASKDTTTTQRETSTAQIDGIKQFSVDDIPF